MAIIPSEVGKNIIIDTPQRQKTKKLTSLLIGVVILMAVIIYFGFFNDSSSPVAEGPGQMSSSQMKQISQDTKLFESLDKVTLESPIFKDKKFQSLIQNSRLPVVIGEKGRQNPFAPF